MTTAPDIETLAGIALTPTEIEILRLMACGLSYAQIATLRGCSWRTVKCTHAVHIYDKIGVSSATQAALYAWRNGIISVDAAWRVLKAATG